MNKYRVHGVITFRTALTPTMTERKTVEVEAPDRKQALRAGKAALEEEARLHSPFTHEEIVAVTTLIETLGEAQ